MVETEKTRAMLVDEAIAVTREILTADRHPRAAEILDACRQEIERMNLRPAIRWLETFSANVARARWRAMVSVSVRRQVADLRPS
jgi:hypothetical protein